MNELWPNLEERRTVVGSDVDGVSETSIRTRADLPPRYIYQSDEIKMLERAATVKNILKDDYKNAKFITDIIEEVVDANHSCIKGDDICSELTPLSVLMDKGITSEQIKTQIKKHSKLITTQKIYSVLLNPQQHNPIMLFLTGDPETKAVRLLLLRDIINIEQPAVQFDGWK